MHFTHLLLLSLTVKFLSFDRIRKIVLELFLIDGVRFISLDLLGLLFRPLRWWLLNLGRTCQIRIRRLIATRLWASVISIAIELLAAIILLLSSTSLRASTV